MSFNFKKALGISALLVALKLVILFFTLSTIETPVLCSWDCPYYQEIAEKGYEWRPNQQGPLAFFPLFPLVVGGIKSVAFPEVSFAAVGIGLNVALFGTFSFLFMYWCFLVGLQVFWLPAILLAVDRFSLWATVPYTEPLFLNFMMLFFLSLRLLPAASLKRLLIPAIIGGVASASRIVGVALVAALGLSHFNYFLRRPFLGLLCLALGLTGVAAFFGYVHLELGSWDMSLRTTAAWNRKFSLLGVFNSIYYLVKHFYFPTILTWGLTLWLMFRGPKDLTINLTEKWLMGLLIFIPMANTIPVGVSRYFSVLLFGPLMLSYLYLKTKHWFWKLALLVFVVSELYWQMRLLGKFFRVEVFSWAG